MEVGTAADPRLRGIARAAELLGNDAAHGPLQTATELRRDLARATILAYELIDLRSQFIERRAVGLDGRVERGLVQRQLRLGSLLLGQLSLQLGLQRGELVLGVGQLRLFVVELMPLSCDLAYELPVGRGGHLHGLSHLGQDRLVALDFVGQLLVGRRKRVVVGDIRKGIGE